MEDRRRWVTVASYMAPWMAHLAQARLAAEDIDAELVDEHTAQLDWVYANAIGGVKVRVDPRDAADAHRILAEAAEIPDFEEQDSERTGTARTTDEPRASPGPARPRRPVNSRVAAGARRVLGAGRLQAPFERDGGRPAGDDAQPALGDRKHPACPDCKGHRVERERGKWWGALRGSAAREWSCRNCGRRFSTR
jgi:hypothetical protein